MSKNNRQKNRQLLHEIGFTSREVDIIEQLAASSDMSVKQKIRQALRVQQMIETGHAEFRVLGEQYYGCGVVE